MLHRIEKFLDEKVRPSLKSHGGDLEVIDFDNHKLFVKLQGGCQGCSSSKATLKDGVEVMLKREFPEMVNEVVDLTDHEAGQNPYM